MRELKAVPGTSLRSNLKKLEKFSRDLVLRKPIPPKKNMDGDLVSPTFSDVRGSFWRDGFEPKFSVAT